nr:MAG TPA: hypothetical protein [Caudoviricetes sp.]
MNASLKVSVKRLPIVSQRESTASWRLDQAPIMVLL